MAYSALLSGTGVPRDVLEGEMPFQIIAGSDTTATAIRGIMLNLMTTPYAYQTLQKEIRTAIFKDQISSPVGSQEGKQLEYLQI
ncbi:putative Cytochrome P450 [Seiridium unicorne]|uniref:Cytochrome P450 n=1 Tax=Seiridium unicorne TaxID=138068 RepID=A0ABR2V1U8_9PEZI